MDNKDRIEEIGALIYEEIGMSPTMGRVFARFGLGAVESSMTDRQIEDSAYKALNGYFIGWGKGLNRRIAQSFVRAYRETS